MRIIAIIFMPFVLIYLAGVMVSLQWSPCDWSLAVQIAAVIFALAHCALIAYMIYAFKTIKTEQQ